MEIVHTACAGMDVHKKKVTVCTLIGPPGPDAESRFGPIER